ncbi:hypothetical protein [Candidatus Mycoplasma mahonii]|uniref:hypothetical protein n=1 Tax=Candidatus Mycoplasma mahonii TaxID=3004105 RepID=UPI0026E93433|nr:hypothetical protein [Candidatus Mycoplasma mahonii]WKX02689.1 hypothetical protein O3I44_01275 [Candidatus Mycoplasma mahonii]
MLNTSKYITLNNCAHARWWIVTTIRELSGSIIDFISFVVWKIKEIKINEKSNKLFTLNVETDRKLQIVKNANNVAVCLNIVVTYLGATLANKTTILNSKIMGIISEGMLCSNETFGLRKKDEKIITDLKNGTPYIF